MEKNLSLKKKNKQIAADQEIMRQQASELAQIATEKNRFFNNYKSEEY